MSQIPDFANVPFAAPSNPICTDVSPAFFTVTEFAATAGTDIANATMVAGRTNAAARIGISRDARIYPAARRVKSPILRQQVPERSHG